MTSTVVCSPRQALKTAPPPVSDRANTQDQLRVTYNRDMFWVVRPLVARSLLQWSAALLRDHTRC